MGTLKKLGPNGDQKTHFGPHGNQSPQMGTNVGAVIEPILLKKAGRTWGIFQVPIFSISDLRTRQKSVQPLSKVNHEITCGNKN